MIPARILLIHGALADGSSWSKVIPSLQAAGHNVTSVQQPLTSLPDDIRTVKATLKGLNDENDVPIIVAGHSFGGFVMTNAVTNAPNVKGLVFVSAFAPAEGESVSELSANYPLESAKHLTTDGSGRLILSQPDYLKYFAPDVEHREAKILAAAQGPFDAARFDFRSGKPAWKQTKNIHYVITEKDQMVHPGLQAFFARRLGAKTLKLKDASHAGLISHGQAVADAILDAANSC